MSFTDGFRGNSNLTRTENGATVKSTTGSALLNLFARVGGLRQASESEINRLYLDARNEDKELADNLILYTRNIREGGIGERRIARILLKTIALKDPAKVRRNLDTIVSAGRWDDLFVFEGTSVENDALEFMKEQFRKDVLDMGKGETISLLAKWLPSANTSSKETRRLARKVYTYFGLSERTYRKTLSALRKYLDVVEKKMSAQDFTTIDYKAVPSVAMTRYRSAFGKHDFERFNAYINAVTSGETKINASVTYPYELAKPYVDAVTGWYSRSRANLDPVLEAQWKALPNYVKGEHNAIVLADVSGSMTGLPMATSISLGIYFAERNTGAYKNLVMSFTNKPSLYTLNPSDSLLSRVQQVASHEGLNTNLDLAFERIYDIAKREHDAPSALIVISDGEIDSYRRRLESQGSSFEGIAEKWQAKYASIGLKAPKLIMWNVASRGDRYIASKENRGAAYVSGSSAATFKELTTLISQDAMTAMKEILSRPAFQWK